MKIEFVNIKQVKKNPVNPRIIKDDKFQKLVESIKAFPKMLEIRPIVVNNDMIVLGGNMRLKACTEAGLKEIPIIRADDLTDEQQKEFIIKDNVGFGDWDWVQLANEWDLSALDAWGLDVPEFTTEADAVEGLTDPDDAPEVADDPVSRQGDIWILGNHRLMCGDSTSIDDVEKLCGGSKIDMWLTDPPYNVAYEGKTKDALTIKNDSMDDSSFRQFLVDCYTSADANMREGAVFYIWHADSEGYNFRGACFEIGWKVRQCLIWKKQTMVLGRQDYHCQHEPCLYGWKDGSAHFWANDRKQTTILEFNKPSRNGEHPTMKPVDLFEYCLLNNTKVGDFVLDSFGESGTTMIACEKNNRKARLMELDPKYCDVIIKRWQNFTGKKATLEVDGRTFEEVANNAKS